MTGVDPSVPLGYLQGYGSRAHPVVDLTWALLVLSVLVVLVIGTLVVVGTWRRRARETASAAVPIVRSGSGLRWIAVGMAVTLPLLLVSVAWTAVVLAKTASPPGGAGEPLRLEVVAHQWWWEVRYLADDPAAVFLTANEIHVPAGRPVAIELRSADVIHSFWVPTLGGKTDLIPGRVNRLWIAADRPGRYRGQCVEYCGLQHAHMGLTVVADPPAEFERWRAGQLADARPVAGEAARRGLAIFVTHCAACHTVRGTGAGGVLGPELTHVMSRRAVAAELLPNTPGHLLGWIGNPQALKPGAGMPSVPLTGAQLQQLRAYLETLQ